MNFILKAIKNLRPSSAFGVEDTYESLIWQDDSTTPPTKEEVELEIDKLKQEYQRSEYQRSRKKEYPSFEDQFDILYHQGFDAWKSKIDEIKAKYPKPE